MQRFLVTLIIAGSPCVGAAQPASGPSFEDAAALAVEVSSAVECDVDLVSGIRTDELLGQRYVAYVASGADCDAVSQELSTRGAEVDLVFLRRPNLAQLRALVAGMVRSVEMTTGCRVSMRGTPSLDATTSRWLVSYVASGDNCREVGQELRDLGKDFDIAFLG